MRLYHVTGNTYYVNYPSIVGVYKFENNNSCLLIDSGASSNFGIRTLKTLASRGLKVAGIINTHFHGDHSGGNQVIQNETNCAIYASKQDKVFLENPILSPYGIYSAYPFKHLQNKFLMPEASRVTHTIESGINEINQEKFEMLDLSGHTLGQLGIVTPDQVFFLGDALISRRNLEKFPFLYIANLDYHLDTIARIKNTDYPYVVLSHGGLLENWREMLVENEAQIEKILNIILDFLSEAKSRESIYQEVIEKLDLPINTSQYFLISASISAFLTHLHNRKLISSIVVDKQVKFIGK